MKHSTSLFDTDGRVSNPFAKLLDLFGVQHDGTLKNIRDATQAEWYKEGKFRAEITEEHGDRKDEAMQLFANLGFIGATHSVRRNYTHALLLGAKVKAVRKRLSFLRNEWERGVRFDFLYLLGSMRPLFPDENEDTLLNPENEDLPFDSAEGERAIPANEAKMMNLVYDQAKSRFPWDVPMELITTRIEGRNANTGETLNEWGKRVLKSGPCLVVSSQPFVSFQEIMARKILREDRHPLIKCIGYASPALPVTTYLDNVAKIVFELAKSEEET